MRIGWGLAADERVVLDFDVDKNRFGGFYAFEFLECVF